MVDSRQGTSYTPVTGATADGVPLALNRAPAPDLEPWIARVMVAIAHAPPDTVSTGYLCNDASYVRTAIGGHWTVDTAEGEHEYCDESLVCGQHTRAWKLVYRGPVIVSGFMLKPGAFRAIWGVEDGQLVDCIRPTSLLGFDDAELTGLYQPGIAAEEWLGRLEGWLRRTIRIRNAAPPEPLSQRLDEAAFSNPNQAPGEVADQHGATARKLQRVAKRDFGLSPKHVLRRARVLDLAARLCGVADEQEEEEFLLRYFDQSHQIRDFGAFFGRSPQQFMMDRQPLLTLSLEIRQARRLELLDRIAPDAVRPWMRQTSLPPLTRAAD